LRPLIPDAAEVEARWATKHGGVPINHMMVIKDSIAQNRPDVVREVYRLLKESAADSRAKRPGVLRFGIDEVRPSLEAIIAYSEQQGLLPRHFTIDELFGDAARMLE
jgi:4,5-dihydroxyphthalate decarboxylase